MTDAEIELDMLRDFHGKWKHLHSLKNDKIHRNQLERAAQDLVDAADTLENFYHPIQLVIN
jgi:hypothetical protein